MKPTLVDIQFLFTPDQTKEGDDNFWGIAEASIGSGGKAPDGTPSSDTFTFYVTTPKWLEQRRAEQPFYNPGPHVIVVQNYDEDVIRRCIQNILDKIEGASWEEVAHKVGEFGHWEFENYKEFPENDKGSAASS